MSGPNGIKRSIEVCPYRGAPSGGICADRGSDFPMGTGAADEPVDMLPLAPDLGKGAVDLLPARDVAFGCAEGAIRTSNKFGLVRPSKSPNAVIFHHQTPDKSPADTGAGSCYDNIHHSGLSGTAKAGRNVGAPPFFSGE